MFNLKKTTPALIYIFIAIAIAVLLITASKTPQSSTTSSQETSIELPLPGLQKGKELQEEYNELVKHFDMHLNFAGALVSYKPNKSWTIEKGGKTLTLTNPRGRKVEHLNFSSGESIEASSLVIGNTILIKANLDPSSAELSVRSIEIEHTTCHVD